MAIKLDYDKIDRAVDEGKKDKSAGHPRKTPHLDGIISSLRNTEQQNAENRAYTKAYIDEKTK